MSELSTYLCHGREQAGLSLAQVSSTTRIPVQSLEALEQERWSALPQSVYVRGFVVSYCRAVGVSEAPALRELPRSLENRPESSALSVKTRGDSILYPQASIGRRPSSAHLAYLAIILVFAVGVLLAIFAMGHKTGSSDLSRAVDTPRSSWTLPGDAPPANIRP